MAVLLHPRRWHVKPALGAQINGGHPLAVGLVGCFLLNEQGGFPRNLVTGQPSGLGAGSGASPTWNVGQAGLVRRYVGTPSIAYDQFSNHAIYGLTSAVSIAARVVRTAAQNGGGILEKRLVSGASSESNYQLDVGFGASFQFTPLFVYTNSSSFHEFQSGGALAQNVPTNLLSSYVSATPSSAKIYINGIDKGGSWVAGTGSAALQANTDTLQLGQQEGQTDGNFGGDIAHCYLWGRALSASEAEWLNVEPYAFIIPPQPRRMWFIPPAPSLFSGGQPNVCVATF